MQQLIAAIEAKHQETGIKVNPPASDDAIKSFEKKTGFSLPPDFTAFYSICNGFECDEDLFRMVALEEIIERRDYGKDWFHFAEYMIFSDMWSLRKTQNGQYLILNGSFKSILTSSLHEFLERFLQGNVFDENGLYAWQDELMKTKS